MVVVFIFILVCFFVIIPLYKSVRKMKASKALNEQLDRLAKMYDYGMATYNFPFAESCLDQAREAVRTFNADVRLTPQELLQVAPVVRAFPNWQTWL